MRKLASIQRIDSLTKHPNADALEIASISGFQVIVKLGAFNLFDHCILLEVDSLLGPECSWWSEIYCPGVSRVRTIKLRGEISQGIALPVEILPLKQDRVLGEDFSEYLQVSKYEPPLDINLRADPAGKFPEFIPKTDEVRWQNIREQIPEGARFDITEKLDGSSITVFRKDGHFGVCSRNFELKRGENAFWRAVDRCQVEKFLSWSLSDIALQGELLGPGIQGNRYQLKDYEIYFFNKIDLDTQKRASNRELESFCQAFRLKTVPLLEDLGKWDPQEFQKIAQTPSRLNSKISKEGIVCRNSSLSFKVLNPQFALKFGD